MHRFTSMGAMLRDVVVVRTYVLRYALASHMPLLMMTMKMNVKVL